MKTSRHRHKSALKIRKRHLYIRFILLIIAIGVVIFLFLLFSSSTSFKDTTYETKGKSTPSLAKKEINQVALDGQFVRFSYPSNYRRIPSQADPNRENINLLGSIAYEGEIAVSVSRGSLGENSAIMFRRLNKEVYSEQTLKLPNISGIMFTKQSSGFEKTAMVQQGGMVASIAVTSSAGTDLSTVFDTVTKSFVWK